MYAVSRIRFEQLVAEAMDLVPDSLASVIDNCVVVVDDWPTTEQQQDSNEPLLGLYEGVNLTDRDDYHGALPDRITLFRGPLCEYAEGEEDLRREIAITLVHELGHHFGIDDARLHDLGWA